MPDRAADSAGQLVAEIRPRLGQLHARVFPGGGCRARHVAVLEQRRDQPRHDDHQHHAVAAAGERDDALGLAAGEGERLVAAAFEQGGVAPPERERERDHVLLDPAIAPLREQGRRRDRSLEAGVAQIVVHRAAVVGIDQAQVPQLAALIDVRHAGHGQLEQRLGEAVARADRARSAPRRRADRR